jgi:alpha-beta hydrolase superfamily lysophospholipase
MKRTLSRLHLPALAVAGLVAALSCTAEDAAPMTTRDFTFVSGGKTLSGVIDQPASGVARALIVFVHGYGTTDVLGWDMYADLRGRFARLGVASATWDKPGQGRSEGAFDINQGDLPHRPGGVPLR